MSRPRAGLLIGLSLSCLGLGASVTRAETTVGSSLEWLTCSSDVVALGRIEKVVTTRGPGPAFYDDCTVAVRETIKGRVEGGRLVFCFRSLETETPVRAWMRSRKGLLLFLSGSKNHGSERHLDGVLVPTATEFPLSVIDLSAPGRYVFDARLRVLGDDREVLGICRKAAGDLAEHLERHPGSKPEARRLEVPPAGKAWRSLYAGSGCYIMVPAFLVRRGLE